MMRHQLPTLDIFLSLDLFVERRERGGRAGMNGLDRLSISGTRKARVGPVTVTRFDS